METRKNSLPISTTYFHDDFLGWVDPDYPFADKKGLLQFIIEDIAEAGTYSFEIERVDSRLIGDVVTTYLLFHCSGTNAEGVDYKETFRWAHTWIRDSGAWKILLGTSYEIGK